MNRKCNKTILGYAFLSTFLFSVNATADSHRHHQGTMSMKAMPSTAEMPMHGDGGDRSHAPSTQAIAASGVIREILTTSHQLKIYHDPIDAWQMGAMQMKFRLTPGLDIDTLRIGQRIQFQLHREGIGNYLITDITAIAD